MRDAKQTYADVVESFQNGNFTARKISEDTGVPTSTVKDYLVKWKSGVPVDDIRGRGRPRLLSANDRTSLVALVGKDPFQTSKNLSICTCLII